MISTLGFRLTDVFTVHEAEIQSFAFWWLAQKFPLLTLKEWGSHGKQSRVQLGLNILEFWFQYHPDKCQLAFLKSLKWFYSVFQHVFWVSVCFFPSSVFWASVQHSTWGYQNYLGRFKRLFCASQNQKNEPRHKNPDDRMNPNSFWCICFASAGETFWLLVVLQIKDLSDSLVVVRF